MNRKNSEMIVAPVFVERVSPKGTTNPRSIYLCQCGSRFETLEFSVRHGHTRSCGCMRRELQTKAVTVHGHAGGAKDSPTYISWRSMIYRCTTPTSADYHRYGAKGVTVCDRWRGNFEAFLADMGERPFGKTLDRFPNNSGDYEPGNCRWATHEEQCNNRGTNVFYSVDGETMSAKQIADKYDISLRLLNSRIHRGWPIEKCIVTPVMKQFSRTEGVSQ